MAKFPAMGVPSIPRRLTAKTCTGLAFCSLHSLQVVNARDDREKRGNWCPKFSCAVPMSVCGSSITSHIRTCQMSRICLYLGMLFQTIWTQESHGRYLVSRYLCSQSMISYSLWEFEHLLMMYQSFQCWKNSRRSFVSFYLSSIPSKLWQLEHGIANVQSILIWKERLRRQFVDEPRLGAFFRRKD